MPANCRKRQNCKSKNKDKKKGKKNDIESMPMPCCKIRPYIGVKKEALDTA
jgi:hypothetical protein